MKKGLYVVIVIVFIVCVVGSFAIGRASAPKPVNSEDNSSESGEMTVYPSKMRGSVSLVSEDGTVRVEAFDTNEYEYRVGPFEFKIGDAEVWDKTVSPMAKLSASDIAVGDIVEVYFVAAYSYDDGGRIYDSEGNLLPLDLGEVYQVLRIGTTS